jgi:hypothetical protein
MKTIIKPIIFLILALGSQAVYAQQKSDDLVATFFKGIADGNTSVLYDLMPSVTWMREKIPGLENEEFTDEMVATERHSWVGQTIDGYHQIIVNAQDRNIDFSTLKIGEITMEEESLDSPITMIHFGITLHYGDKSTKFNLVCTPYADGYFILSIPMSFGVFDGLN